METYFAVIRIPHETPVEIHYNVSDTTKTIEDTINWNSTIAEYRTMWEESNPHIPFIEPDTIEYDSHQYRLGELVYDPFWDDVHSILTFATEKELIEHCRYLRRSPRKPHRWFEILSLLAFYLKCKSI